jgi:tetratricopeptide (TPR) repeat protein
MMAHDEDNVTTRFLRLAVLVIALSATSATLAQSPQADRWKALTGAGNFALQKHQYLAAKKDFDQALKEAERLGFEDPLVSKSYKLLGDFYFAQQKYDTAQSYYSRSEVLENYATGLKTADLAMLSGDFAHAKSSSQFELDYVLQPKFGTRDVLLTPALISLARAEKELTQDTEAEAMLNRAIKILQPAASESREMAAAQDLLGQIYDEEGKVADAEPLLKNALEIRTKILEADDAQMEASYDHLAQHYQRIGHTAEQQAYKNQAAECQEKAMSNLVDYTDKENNFRLSIPKNWSRSTGQAQIPGGLAVFQSNDLNGAAMVQRVAVPQTADSTVFDLMSNGIASGGGGAILGEENVTLSGMPARRIVFSLGVGKVMGRDWATILISQNHVWILHVIGPEAGFNSPEGAYSRAAQTIAASFTFLEPALQVIKANVVVPPPPVQTITGGPTQCRRYENREVAMQVLLPDGWQETSQTPASIGGGKIVILNKTGTLAVVILGREELEASEELYLKSLEGSIREKSENFQEISETKVTRQGHPGTRVVLATRENGIDYRNILEVYSDGNAHYRIIARAPAEVFDRYTAAFSDMLQSVELIPIAGQNPPDSPAPVQVTPIAKH